MIDSKNKIICCYPGRFQPMHAGHIAVYKHLCDLFGKDNVWITTSNKQESNSPLTFKQKQCIGSAFFNISKSRIIQCKIPYVPHELLDKITDKDFTLVLALGEKDKDRLIGRDYFCKLPRNMKNLKKVEEKTYVYATPMFENGQNATSIRNKFLGPQSVREKKALFVKLFGQFDQHIFDTLLNKY